MKYQQNRPRLGFGRQPLATFALGALFGAAWAAGTYEARERFGHSRVPADAAREASLAPLDLALEPAAAVAISAAPSWDLPNLDHPRVDYWVDAFSTRKRKEFAHYLARMGRYQPMISQKLAERGMPQDLIYLAMIESGFNPKAYSHAHASGLWQFISETGRRYGLDINRAVDERNDPEKATDAALDYLTKLHGQFGSWYLAAAAYNSGEGRVSRIMRQTTGSEKGSEESYYRIWNRLPRETRDYVPLMVAAARIAKEPEKYGFDDVKMEDPLAYDVVVVEPASSLNAIAAASGTTVSELKRLNPQLKLSRTRNDMRSAVRIPRGSREAFAAKWPEVRTQAVRFAQAEESRAKARPKARARNYRVRRGDNLSTIAQRHGVSVRALKRANGMRGDRIRAGSVLKIPTRS